MRKVKKREDPENKFYGSSLSWDARTGMRKCESNLNIQVQDEPPINPAENCARLFQVGFFGGIARL